MVGAPVSAAEAPRPDAAWESSRDAALGYGRVGFRVIPLRTDRLPALEKWPLRATSDASEITRLWTICSDVAGVGILTGEDNTWILDLDIKNGKRGDDELAALIAKHGPLPDTVTARTGTGGFHLYFAPDPRIHRSANAIAPGIDVLGFHSFVVAPPTMNLETNKPYAFEIGAGPDDLRPARAPDWLVRLAIDASSHATDGTRKTAQTSAAPIPEGQRDVTLTSLAGSLRRIGLSENQIAVALLEVNRDRCQPSLPDAIVLKVARSVARYPAGELPRGTAPDPVSSGRWICAEDVVAERIEWLWRPRIALGKLTVVDGDPGLGKSTMMLDLAARVSTGFEMPDHSTGIPASGVVILTAEDGLGDTVRPRLEAAGADLSRINLFGFEHEVVLPDHIDLVAEAAREKSAKLLLIDPLMAYLSPDINAHRDQDVRRALKRFSALAAELGAAVVVVRHLNKQAGVNALYRGGGSIGIAGAARGALLVAEDSERPGVRVLAAGKNNLGMKAPALAFTIEQSDPADLHSASRIRWLGESARTTESLLSPPLAEKDRGAAADAIDFLRDALEEGAVAVKAVEKDAKGAGVSEWALKEAKRRLGVKARKEGFGEAGCWVWELP
jgi:hypothetical protein